MGDNVYLGDRDSVRTPMQWSPDRNGGFSRADFAQLYLPPLMDPVYGFEAVNVEAQQRNPSSHPALAPQHPADPQAVPGLRHRAASTWCRAPTRRSSPTSAAHVPAGHRRGPGRSRRPGGRPAGRRRGAAGRGDGRPGTTNPVLCVHNLSRFAQPAELDLARWAERTPVELLGTDTVPARGERRPTA